MKPRSYLRRKPGQATSLLVLRLPFGVGFVVLPMSASCRAAGKGQCGLSGVDRDESSKA